MVSKSPGIDVFGLRGGGRGAMGLRVVRNLWIVERNNSKGGIRFGRGRTFGSKASIYLLPVSANGSRGVRKEAAPVT